MNDVDQTKNGLKLQGDLLESIQGKHLCQRRKLDVIFVMSRREEPHYTDTQQKSHTKKSRMYFGGSFG